MALGRTRSVSIDGIRGHVVEIEADIASGLPGTALVGSADSSLTEARDRCRSAVVNSGGTWPNQRVPQLHLFHESGAVPQAEQGRHRHRVSH
jgi:magnesium chelatase family protein